MVVLLVCAASVVALDASPLLATVLSLSFVGMLSVVWVPDARAVVARVWGILPIAVRGLVGVDPAFGGVFDMPLVWLVFVV